MPRNTDLKSARTSHLSFRMSAFTVVNTNFAGFFFLVDQTRYAQTETKSSVGSNGEGGTITIELQAGQVVQIENQFGSMVEGTDNDGVYLSWFTGHLIQRL